MSAACAPPAVAITAAAPTQARAMGEGMKGRRAAGRRVRISLSPGAWAGALVAREFAQALFSMDFVNPHCCRMPRRHAGGNVCFHFRRGSSDRA
jgi:hypothetical protein